MIKETLTNLLSQLAPLTLVKQIFPAPKSTQTFALQPTETKPSLNVDEIELTADDFS